MANIALLNAGLNRKRKVKRLNATFAQKISGKVQRNYRGQKAVYFFVANRAKLYGVIVIFRGKTAQIGISEKLFIKSF
jgi:hypothetical protein